MNSKNGYLSYTSKNHQTINIEESLDWFLFFLVNTGKLYFMNYAIPPN